MKKLIILGMAILICGCSHHVVERDIQPSGKEETVFEASIPYPLVKWNDRIYRITQTKITNVDKEIGEITTQSMNEIAETPNNFSTTFAKGSKLYSIIGMDTKEAIAVKISEDEYIKVITPSNE
ncbi:hypothetical protein Back11_09030 [Paenibacillus baekrokdamisoli]|uniref:Uncharacterized protein n=1 Tax=Paenibacillus baekrokdamisoli TaxID=1712516 RepID=A0A3G9J702_9BACL|nr:hypothetical protein [Paenibacillus baekrokdamisoli]MBB3067253.1 hypothetical protein [Paenibacillus baekrokdamisoli]BBH19558.1 hypothetical protein Back11_09030 [Paenibacillus baekrokdamisoli]